VTPKNKRYRLRYTFWLNHLNQDELTVADTIERLKNERSFATVVRDGIMIVSELRAGRIDLLLKLFPWVADAIKAATPLPPAPPDSGDMERKIASAVQTGIQQALLELPATIPAPPMDYPLMKSASAGGALPLGGTGNLKLGSGKSLDISMPTFDDDDDQETVVIRRNATDETEDFVTRMMRQVEALANAPVKEQRVAPIREFHNRGVAEDNYEIRTVSVEDGDEPPVSHKQGRSKDKGAKLTGLQPLI